MGFFDGVGKALNSMANGLEKSRIIQEIEERSATYSLEWILAPWIKLQNIPVDDVKRYITEGGSSPFRQNIITDDDARSANIPELSGYRFKPGSGSYYTVPAMMYLYLLDKNYIGKSEATPSEKRFIDRIYETNDMILRVAERRKHKMSSVSNREVSYFPTDKEYMILAGVESLSKAAAARYKEVLGK